MLNRRDLLVLTTGLTLLASPALAQSWKDKYPELVMALVPAENATGTLDRFTPFVNYLSKELGVKVTLRVASSSAVSATAIQPTWKPIGTKS
jgi:phosphonate transport system substrate-binding protein